MRKQKKTFSRPKRPFDKVRIDEEVKLKKEFGLKNKTEIWKAEAKVKKMREKAKKLISADKERQERLFKRLQKRGLEINSIADILSLDTKDILNRRLQTLVVKKGLASTLKSARQLITHKKILVNGRAVSSPSYNVPKDLEDKIELRNVKTKKTQDTETQTQETPKEENKQVQEVAANA